LVNFEQIEEFTSEKDRDLMYASDEYTYITKHKYAPNKTWENAVKSVFEDKRIPLSRFLQWHLIRDYYTDASATLDRAKSKIS
jgi:hypothetical protein